MGKTLIISIIIIIIIATGLGFYFLNNSDTTNENEKPLISSLEESSVLSGVDENALCYETLREAGSIMMNSCSDKNIIIALDLIGEKTNSMTDEGKEECIRTLNNQVELIEELCGKRMIDILDTYADQKKEERDKALGDATDCFDKTAMGLPCD